MDVLYDSPYGSLAESQARGVTKGCWVCPAGRRTLHAGTRALPIRRSSAAGHGILQERQQPRFGLRKGSAAVPSKQFVGGATSPVEAGVRNSIGGSLKIPTNC